MPVSANVVLPSQACWQITVCLFVVLCIRRWLLSKALLLPSFSDGRYFTDRYTFSVVVFWHMIQPPGTDCLFSSSLIYQAPSRPSLDLHILISSYSFACFPFFLSGRSRTSGGRQRSLISPTKSSHAALAIGRSTTGKFACSFGIGRSWVIRSLTSILIYESAWGFCIPDCNSFSTFRCSFSPIFMTEIKLK